MKIALFVFVTTVFATVMTCWMSVAPRTVRSD